LRKTERAKLIPAKYIPDDNPTTSSTLIGPHRKPSTTLISSTPSTRVLREAAANGALIDTTEFPTSNTTPVPGCTEHDTEAIPNPPDTITNTGVGKKKRKRNMQATYQNDEYSGVSAFLIEIVLSLSQAISPPKVELRKRRQCGVSDAYPPDH
jgi:hypothetical protein